jgi:hypothetical protein
VGFYRDLVEALLGVATAFAREGSKAWPMATAAL